MVRIQPVLLAGGSGTRLWPLSRKSFPKQFSKLFDEETLFQQSALRLKSSDIVETAPPIIVTNSDFRFIVSQQLQEVDVDPGPILIEPEGKNTAAAILAASIFAQSKDDEVVLLVAPSDHIVADLQDFHHAISFGIPHVENAKIVTFGIKTTRPETGFGYMELSTLKLDQHGTSDVLKFVEKPDYASAERMLLEDSFFWNSGIFLFKASSIIDAFQVHAPDALKHVLTAVNDASEDLGFLRLSAEPWAKLKNISIDYAIMEKVENLVAVPYLSGWSDLGGWNSIWSESSKDANENVTNFGAHAIDCSNSLLRSESRRIQLVGLGLNDIIAIAMPDAVLVAKKEKAEDIKKVVEYLKSHSIKQAEISSKDYRPWGWFESLVLHERFQVKIINVKPGAALSLQSHQFRSEHWVIVEGVAEVTIDNKTEILKMGQSVFVPIGAVHRIQNPGVDKLVLIEVQIGSYLGEDDIIRYEDFYRRR